MSECTSCNGCSSQKVCSVSQKFNATKEEFAAQNEFRYNFEEYSRPLAMMLGLTNSCNLACPYCFVSQSADNMSLETAEKSIEWLATNYEAQGIDTYEDKMIVNFFGGEPLLRFEEVIVPLVEKYHETVCFGITTNGVLLTPDVVDFFYKYGIQPLLSLDGCAEVQNTQRPGRGFDSFEAVLKNLSYLLLRFPNTTMRATLTHNSIPYLLENVLMAEEIGFQKVTFCPNAFEEWTLEDEKILAKQFSDIGLHVYKKLLSPSEYPVIQVDPLVRRVSHIDLAVLGQLKFNNELLRCGLGTTSCSITPDGSIIPCQEKTSNPTVIIGNVLDGIDEGIHESFLLEYWSNINEISCNRHCSERERVVCLSDTCPSRLEDQDFTFSTSICVFNRTSLKAAAKLHFLCSHSINPYIRDYFSGGTIC